VRWGGIFWDIDAKLIEIENEQRKILSPWFLEIIHRKHRRIWKFIQSKNMARWNYNAAWNAYCRIGSIDRISTRGKKFQKKEVEQPNMRRLWIPLKRWIQEYAFQKKGDWTTSSTSDYSRRRRYWKVWLGSKWLLRMYMMVGQEKEWLMKSQPLTIKKVDVSWY